MTGSLCIRAPLQFAVQQAVKQPTTGHSPSPSRSTVQNQRAVWKQQRLHPDTGQQSQLNHAEKVRQKPTKPQEHATLQANNH